jgi:hypothetical protein
MILFIGSHKNLTTGNKAHPTSLRVPVSLR